MDDGFFLVALMEESNRDVKREGVKEIALNKI